MWTSAGPDRIDIVLLNNALERLEGWDSRQARIVDLRCFLGLSIEEVAEALEISQGTVKREWAMARAWLQGVLAPAATA